MESGKESFSAWKWSIFAGFFSLDHANYDKRVVDTIKDKCVTYAESAKPKVRAAELLIYAFKLCNPEITDNTVDLRLIEIDITKGVVEYAYLAEKFKTFELDAELQRISDDRPPVSDVLDQMYKDGAIDEETFNFSQGAVSALMLAELK